MWNSIKFNHCMCFLIFTSSILSKVTVFRTKAISDTHWTLLTVVLAMVFRGSNICICIFSTSFNVLLTTKQTVVIFTLKIYHYQNHVGLLGYCTALSVRVVSLHNDTGKIRNLSRFNCNWFTVPSGKHNYLYWLTMFKTTYYTNCKYIFIT